MKDETLSKITIAYISFLAGVWTITILAVLCGAC